MKLSLVAVAILVCASLIVNVSGASWHTAESWSTDVNVQTNPYFYIVHGPFTENGVAYNGLVNVTVSFADESPVTFALSNGGTYSFSTAHPASTLYWNLTTDYTHSRQISFGSGFSDEVYLYVGDSDDILASYGVVVTDFAGLTNATAETEKNVLGINQVVERQNLDVMGNMYFYLVMYSQYTFKIVSDQGTFSWALSADSSSTKTFTITRDMVTQANTATNMTVTATRNNATSATVYFNDPSHVTTSITTNIYLRNATGLHLFYTQTDEGYTQNFTLYSLVATANYIAKITIQPSALTWTITLSTLPVATSIWGVSFDAFGDWSYLAKNAVGMFIVMALISVGSWKDTEWFLAAGIIVAAFMVYIGMLSIPWAGISAALLVVVLMYIDKAKKEMPYS